MILSLIIKIPLLKINNNLMTIKILILMTNKILILMTNKRKLILITKLKFEKNKYLKILIMILKSTNKIKRIYNQPMSKEINSQNFKTKIIRVIIIKKQILILSLTQIHTFILIKNYLQKIKV